MTPGIASAVNCGETVARATDMSWCTGTWLAVAPSDVDVDVLYAYVVDAVAYTGFMFVVVSHSNTFKTTVVV